MTQWKRTFALALELPLDATEDELWEKLIIKHPKFTEFFITASTTIDIIRLPYIGFSMVTWFSKQTNFDKKERQNFESVHTEFLREFRRREINEITSFSEEDLESFNINYAKYKSKLKALDDPYNIYNRFLDFLNDLDLEIENILYEEEN